MQASPSLYGLLAVIPALLLVVALALPHVAIGERALWAVITCGALLSLVEAALGAVLVLHLHGDRRFVGFTCAMGFALAVGGVLWARALLVKIGGGATAFDNTPLLPPDAARGRAVVVERACFTCHHISDIANARGTVGPPLDDIGNVAATRKSGMDARAYIEESIDAPLAFLTPGYGPNMPPDIRATLTPQQYVDVVAYLLALKKKRAP